jgi:hypothetical protein
VKVVVGSQWRQPHLFIGGESGSRFTVASAPFIYRGETQRSRILNATVEIEGIYVIQARVSGTDAGEDVFFRLDYRSPDFAGSGLQRGKRLTIEGLMLGGFRIKPFVYQNIRLFQLFKFDAKGSATKPQELSSPFSSLRIHLSISTLCHLRSNQISPATQGVRVSIRVLVFLHDETAGVNLTHPASHSLGFARGVSSSLTSNAFKFDYNMCFR